MILLKWLALSLAIMFVGWVVPGISISSFITALIASIVIALVNLVIKPILVFFILKKDVTGVRIKSSPPAKTRDTRSLRRNAPV